MLFTNNAQIRELLDELCILGVKIQNSYLLLILRSKTISIIVAGTCMPQAYV